MDNDSIISTLNNLIETSRDGEKGFRKSAEDTKNAELRGLFMEGAESCARGAQELEGAVRTLGGNPDKGGSVSGALHRGWVDVKSAVTGRDDLAILEECERGEDYAKKQYRDAAAQDLPTEIRTIVERQYQGVLRHHDRVKVLRDQYRARRNASDDAGTVTGDTNSSTTSSYRTRENV